MMIIMADNEDDANDTIMRLDDAGVLKSLVGRSSSPCKPWMPGVPFLARRMWMVAVSRSICCQRMSTSSLTRNACRKAMRISNRSLVGFRLLPAVCSSASRLMWRLDVGHFIACATILAPISSRSRAKKL